MSGKSVRCFTLSLICFFSVSLWASSDEFGTKSRLSVNGYDLVNFGKKEIQGLRAKAAADLYMRKGEYSRAIQYYEMASKLIPNEADVYYSLGRIYLIEKVYNLSARYFKIAAEKYRLPENHGKTQKYYYLSRIGYGMALASDTANPERQDEARKVASALIEEESTIASEYPEVMGDYRLFIRRTYGVIYVPVTNKR